MSSLDSSYERAVLPPTATIKQVLLNLNKTALQICLIVEEDGVLLGILTDGDIRRGLLNGANLDTKIDTILHQNILVVPPELDHETAIKVMQANKIRHLPIANERHQLCGLHLLDNPTPTKSRPNTMVIMAGGKGTRLKPHTENCPKPLLTVGKKPMLQHIIERAKANGISHFLISINYLGHMVEEYFGDGSKWQVEIEYLREDLPLGTAGALSLIDPMPSDSIVVTNGDVLTDIGYGEILDFHNLHKDTVATMAVRLHEWQHPYGVVETSGVDILNIEEKPLMKTRINAGIYVLSPPTIKYLQTNASCDMTTLFDRLRLNKLRTIVFPIYEPWLDVGRPSDLDLAENNYTI